jgi:hypothetical protein
MTLNPEQITQLVELYAERCVEDMDTKCLEQFVYDTIRENMLNAGYDDILETISEVYDEEVLQEMVESVKS